MAVDDERRIPYLDAAFALLDEGGYAALKLAPLCARLGVTTGAFYHAFNSWNDFTDQFLEHWREHRTTLLAESARQAPSASAMLEALVGVVLSLPHRAEAAIRVWSSIDAHVASVQAAVDDARLAVAKEAFLQLLCDEAEADRFARLGMMMLIGYEQDAGSTDPAHLEWALRMVQATAEEIGSRRG